MRQWTYELKDKIIGIIAGGNSALCNPIESIENDINIGGEDLKSYNLNKYDSVFVIGASGRTPYCIGTLKYCKK